VTSYHLRGASPAKTRADAVVVGAHRTAKGVTLAEGAEDVADAYGRALRPLLSTLGFTGKAGEVARVPSAGKLSSPLLVLVGMGSPTDDRAATLLAVRRAAGVAARSTSNADSVALALPAGDAALVRNVTEGYLLGAYTFARYLSKAPDPPAGSVSILSPAARRTDATTAFEEAQVVASAVGAVRDWVNTPANDLTPPLLADEIVAAAKGTPVKVKVLDEKRLAELGCGGLLGVGGGSSAPPRLVELRYAPSDPVEHLALVGKGITFDSGGLTIKSGNGMETMKCDMAGAATVTEATLAIARLGLPVQVTAYACLAENMVSGSSMRPGDVLTIYCGTTVEMLNADAEGRLVLADGIARAVEQKPDAIIDFATLTGACQVALGDHATGLMSNNQSLADRVLAAGEKSGDRCWQLPLWKVYGEQIKTAMADVRNTGGRRAGAITAGLFLKEFVGEIPWVHLDIAGTAYADSDQTYVAPYNPKPGATGVGVRLLWHFCQAWT